MKQIQLEDSIVNLLKFEMTYTYGGYLCGTPESVSKRIVERTEKYVAEGEGIMLLTPEYVRKKTWDKCLKDYKYTINVQGTVDGQLYYLTIIFFDDALDDEENLYSFLSEKIGHISLKENGTYIDFDNF